MMNTRKFIAFTCLWLTGSISCIFAQTEKKVTEQSVTLTVEQAVQYARKHSLSVKTADIDLEMKKRAGKYGWNILLPTVNATGTLSRSSNSTYDSVISGMSSMAGDITMGLNNGNLFNNPANMETDIQTYSGSVQSLADSFAVKQGFEDNEAGHWNAVAGLSVGWNFNFAMISQIVAARVGYEAGKISYEETLRDIEVNIRKLFYGLLIQQENLKINKTTLANSLQRYNQAAANYKNGLVPELALLQAQVAYENQRPEVTQLERELNQNLDTFAFLIGYKVGTKIQLEGSIDPEYIDIETDKLFNEYAFNSLSLQALDKGIETIEKNLLAINLSSYTPSISVNYSLNNALPYGIEFDRWGKKDNWKDSDTLSFTVAWNLTNLLPWSSTQQQAKDLKATLEKTKIQREQFLENQKVQLRKNIDTLTSTRAQIDSMSRNVKLAQRSYDMTVRAYQNGTKELLDVRDAESSLNQAKLGLASQKYNYISALLDLETILNTKLTNKVNTNEGETK